MSINESPVNNRSSKNLLPDLPLIPSLDLLNENSQDFDQNPEENEENFQQLDNDMGFDQEGNEMEDPEVKDSL